MTTPVRIQLSRRWGFRLQATSIALNGLPAVKVDRTTRWGNPYCVGVHCDQQHAVDCHHHLVLLGRPAKSAPMTLVDPLAYADFVRRNIADLRGRNVGCWCRLDQPCHADTLLKIAASPVPEPVSADKGSAR